MSLDALADVVSALSLLVNIIVLVKIFHPRCRP
jgi:hypothetical protein